jgi:hypothetical protein
MSLTTRDEDDKCYLYGATLDKRGHGPSATSAEPAWLERNTLSNRSIFTTTPGHLVQFLVSSQDLFSAHPALIIRQFKSVSRF